MEKETKNQLDFNDFVRGKEVEKVIAWSICIEIKFTDGSSLDIYAEDKGDFTYILKDK